jgi:uncharacterized protein RhaS with RHS repeats
MKKIFVTVMLLLVSLSFVGISEARWYDPATGKFLSRDPMGEAADTNVYRFVGNNPVNYVDPLGLYTEIIIWQPVTWGSSSFGHVSTNINGSNYSWGPSGWDSAHPKAADYIKRQETFRSGVGVILNLTPQQEGQLQQCYSKPRGSYSLFTNNCGSPHKDCLNQVLG